VAISRRDLLGVGAAVALATATGSACRRAVREPGPGPSADRDIVATPAVPPPEGMLFYGASLPYHRSLSHWEEQLGSTLSVHRSYFGPEPDQPAQLVTCCRSDLAAGRLSHVSIKPVGTWRDIAAGRHDDWLTEMLIPLGSEGVPALFTVHHEPENEAGTAGMQPSDFVAMQERVIRLAAEYAGAVTVVPVLQHWTFEPMRTDVDPGAWVVPGATAFGLDVYNPWSPTNGKRWRSFGSKVDEVSDWIGGRALVIGEYGCRADPHDPAVAAEWLHDAVDYARSNGIVSMSYFNSATNATDGTWELAGPMEAAFADLLSAGWVARVPGPDGSA